MDKNADLNFWLMEAINNGDWQAVKELLAEGVDPNYISPEDSKYSGKTPLTFAVSLGEGGIARLLLQEGGVLPNDPDILIKPVQSENKGLIKLLLEEGADIHAHDDYALKFSSARGNVEIVKLLLELGADIHAGDDEALQWASSSDRKKVMSLLLEKGADPSNLSFESIDRYSKFLTEHGYDIEEVMKNKIKGHKLKQTEEAKRVLKRDSNFTDKTTDVIKFKNNSDLELLHRLRGYLGIKTKASSIKTSTSHLLVHTLKANGVVIREPFFHSTSFTNGFSILKQGFRAKAGGHGNDAFYDNAVCFTRNLAYTQRGIFGAAEIIFVLDKAELKQKYKIYPYNWFYLNSRYSALDKTDKILFSMWTKGNSRKDLIDYLKDSSYFYGSDPDKYIEDKLIEFRNIPNEAKEHINWEFEERVSTSNPLTEGVKETTIPRKYIKAILLTKVSKVKTIFSNLIDLSIPVFFYNFKNNTYIRLHGDYDINKIELEDLEDLDRDLRNISDVKFLYKIFNSTNDVNVLEKLARNPNTPSDLLELLVDKEDEEEFSDLLFHILNNKNITSNVIEKVYNKIDVNDRYEMELDKIIANPKTPQYILEDIYSQSKKIKEDMFIVSLINTDRLNNMDEDRDRLFNLQNYSKMPDYLRERILRSSKDYSFLIKLFNSDLEFRFKYEATRFLAKRKDVNVNNELFKLVVGNSNALELFNIIKNTGLNLSEFSLVFNKYMELDNKQSTYGSFIKFLEDLTTDKNTAPELLNFLSDKYILGDELLEYIMYNPNTPPDTKADIKQFLISED